MEQAKRNSLRSLMWAMIFYIFFQAAKHISAVATVNPFTEDPYDAIGSFAVQLVLFLALLSVLRSFRPYKDGVLSSVQLNFIDKGHLIGAMAVCLTLLSDTIAMIRHVRMWEPTTVGRLLASTTIAFLLQSIFQFRQYWRSMKRSVPPEHLDSKTSLITLLAFLIVLAIYPEQFRRSLAGELTTVLAGMAMLFVPVGLTARRGITPGSPSSSDVIDDVIAMCEGIQSRVPQFRFCYAVTDRLQHAEWSLRFAAWINPRRYKWRLCLLAGVFLGLSLVTAELWSGSGERLSKMLLVVAVFVGLESVGVLMGFGLLAEPLGLFHAANDGPR